MTILLTGANGFLGQHTKSYFPTSYHLTRDRCDLTNPLQVFDFIDWLRPDTVIHLAADVGGLTYNLSNPATIYHNNVLMNTNLIHYAAIAGCSRFIFISSVCAYPDHAYQPTREHHLWAGFPEVSNGSYGISKRIALTQLEACKQSYDMDYEYLILSNLYGPGDKSNHVIPDLIRKFVANPPTIEVWGNGLQSRDFLYVKDAARAIKHFYDNPLGEPVNIANGYSVTIKHTVDLLAKISGYQGTIVYDMARPQGQINRSYNTDKAKYHGFETMTKFENGLREMWNDFNY